MRVSPCSVVARVLLYVSLCVFMLRRVPLPVRVSPETRQRFQRLRTQRHLNAGAWLRTFIDEALEEQKTTDGLEAERGQGWSMLTSRYLRSAARAAYHLARRSRRKSLRGRTNARLGPPTSRTVQWIPVQIEGYDGGIEAGCYEVSLL